MRDKLADLQQALASMEEYTLRVMDERDAARWERDLWFVVAVVFAILNMVR